MRAIFGSEHSPNLQTVKERKQTTSKTRTAAACGALAEIFLFIIHEKQKNNSS
jgi:hypothetical protein